MSVMLKYLCLGSPVNGCRKEEISIPPQEFDQNHKIFEITPSPFSIKEARILTEGKLVFWDATIFSVLLNFWIKLLFLTPATCLWIFWPVLQQILQA